MSHAHLMLWLQLQAQGKEVLLALDAALVALTLVSVPVCMCISGCMSKPLKQKL